MTLRDIIVCKLFYLYLFAVENRETQPYLKLIFVSYRKCLISLNTPINQFYSQR